MVKKRIVIVSLILLCSSAVKADDNAAGLPAIPADLVGNVPSADKKDSSAALGELASANGQTPAKPAPAPASTGIEDTLAQLLNTPERRVAAARIALFAEMGDRAATASAALVKAESVGPSEEAAVKAAIATYGDAADRSAAIDKIIANVQAEIRFVYAQYSTTADDKLTALETKAANLATVRDNLTAAKNDIVNSNVVIQNADVTLLGYFDVADTATKRVVEGAVLVGGAAVVTGAVLAVRKLTGI